jgi:hypothetical protein
MDSNASEGAYYRYESADGRVHITDSVDKLPPEARASAERVEPVAAPVAIATDSSPIPEVVTREAAARGVDAPSFVFGFGTALALAAVLFLLAKGSRLVLKAVVGVGVVCLLGAAYLGALRRSTGQGDGPLATPGDLVEDARRAVRAAEQRQLEQQRVIDEVERESKK